MLYRNFAKLILVALVCLTIACPKPAVKEDDKPNTSLSGVPSQLLNYRFEADVPAPSDDKKAQVEPRNEAVQKDFDNNRPQEILDKTITSPNKQKVVAVYHQIGDLNSEFRIDMYSAAGKLISKITHEDMAVHFPDTVIWSPDSNNVAFVAMVRGGQTDFTQAKGEPGKDSNSNTSTTVPENKDINSNTEAATESNSNAATNSTDINNQIEPPKQTITFRTEQIYICNADGKEVQPLTQNEGLIYFYFVWSPNSSALAALATPFTEWRIMQQRMTTAGYLFVPQGRPRLVEKNGRERILDDFPTYVQPVWSPDSEKVAVAFNKQIRIYDAISGRVTQAAIPLRNDLLLSSKTYDEKLKAQEASNTATNANGEANTSANKEKSNQNNATAPVDMPDSALPDPNTLVSFNPIIKLDWNQPNILYLQTGFVKDMVDITESVRSYLRWHRLILSSQVANIEQQQQPVPNK